MWEFTCPVCKTDETVLPFGPKTSPVLIIGDHPGKDELRDGKPFVGATGGVLRSELSRVKLDSNRMRMTNLWMHEPNENDECMDVGAKAVLKESQGKKVILLVGSATVKYFANVSVEGYNGLVVACPYFPHAVAVACVQPTTVFHGTLGEFRFAMQQFAVVIRKELG